MNCSRARFLLYAYLDRELSRRDAEDLAHHVSTCSSCAVRAQSARCLARMLRSRIGRSEVPVRLLQKLQGGAPPEIRPRYPLFALAAALGLLVIPLVADVTGPRTAAPTSVVAAGLVVPGHAPALTTRVAPVSRKLTGTIICLECETRLEAGLSPQPDAAHQPALCAENGEVWRLMSRVPGFAQAASGQTVTLEGVAFPESGFLRANRAGY